MKPGRSQVFGVTFVALALIIASRGESIQKRSLWFRAQTFEGEPFATSQECECHFKHVPPKDRQDFIEGDDQWIGHVFKEEEPGTILEFCHATLLWNKRYADSHVVVGWMIKTFVVNDRKKLDDYAGKADPKETQMSSTRTSNDEKNSVKMEQVDPDEMTTISNETIGDLTERATETIDLKTETNDQKMDVKEKEPEAVPAERSPESNDITALGPNFPTLRSEEVGQESDKLQNSEDNENQGSSQAKDMDDIAAHEINVDPDASEFPTTSALNMGTVPIDGDDHRNSSQKKMATIEEPNLIITQTEPDDSKPAVSYEENSEIIPQIHVDQVELTAPIPEELLNGPQLNKNGDVVEDNEGLPEKPTVKGPFSGNP
ncbi:hypothetical protein TCAL_07703 [Tigriopus californicus]|uniref:Uncharacterized protein n=1 Tax=Tigriopus californicus TaxID=6832 RepID=A0A553NCI5_TIGCA|nr:uncharacterized protein LOC131887805 [Tigriopus californicus]TRY63069.1 hypothetical protein TCAL_07703 [Tigriopus californicus]|eukprot:TCALIF_07703-PA protein Name:"Protein of unknown function" AED:0.07 eAED:0.07 QI:0/1/0.33/1/1/1/3/0/373